MEITLIKEPSFQIFNHKFIEITGGVGSNLNIYKNDFLHDALCFYINHEKMPVPDLTDKKISFIREFAHESVVRLSDAVYSHPEPIAKNTKWVLSLISECRRQATLMSSYAVSMERFMDEAGDRSPYFIYASFSDIAEKIFSNINDCLQENAWENDEEVDIEFNEFLFELEEAYFKVKCATTRINLYYYS
jgi:hypothetical protein